ncbi:MFS transporter [uncultured Draconibacterium sp.]|uniref:MFS transporter n=1 Tax=uncultured Draconibacterium sp. TaxID=1573823 RepID=UPI0029C03BF8|nr:MFS transporter [uncultured Draconibacterium sp.]
MEAKKQNYTVPIIMMILLFGMIAFVTNLAAPMGVVLKSQFGASNFQGMMGNAANFIAYAVMGIPGGLLLQKIGYKKTALIAIAVGFVGVGIQYLSGHSSESMAFTVYLIGAFVAGFSMTLLNTVVNPMLNTLGGEGNKGNQLIQVGGSFNSVMATFTPAFVGILIGSQVANARITDIFPVMYIALGIFALAFFVLLAVNIPEPHVSAASESLKSLMSGAMQFRHFIFGAIGIFVYVGVEVGVPGTLIFWLTDPNAAIAIDAGTAGSVAGTYWLLMLVGRLVGASIGSTVSSKTMLTFASFVGMILVLLAIILPTSTVVSMPVFQAQGSSMSFAFAQVPINAMLLVLVGLCTSIMWGGIFNLAVEGLGKYVAAASGIFMTLVVGGGLLPLVQNAVADGLGFQPSYWVPFLGLAYLFFYATIGSKVLKRAESVKL